MPIKTKHGICWDRSDLNQMAEGIRKIITGGRAVTFKKYKKLTASTSIEKIGFFFAWILKKEGRLVEFFPDEIIEIILSKTGEIHWFDEHADLFIKTNICMTAKEISKLLFVPRRDITRRARILGVKLRPERHSFLQREDDFIKKHVLSGLDLDIIAKILKMTYDAVSGRARRLGLHISRKKFVKYSEEELKVLESIDVTKESDEEITKKLSGRTIKSVVMKRRKTGKLRRTNMVWKRFPKKLKYLLNNYQKKSARQIAKTLGLTCGQVEKKAWHEGLRKRPKTPLIIVK